MKECPFCHQEIDDWCWVCPKCHKALPPKPIIGHATHGVFEEEERILPSNEDDSMIQDKTRMKDDDDDSLEPDQPFSTGPSNDDED